MDFGETFHRKLSPTCEPHDPDLAMSRCHPWLVIVL